MNSIRRHVFALFSIMLVLAAFSAPVVRANVASNETSPRIDGTFNSTVARGTYVITGSGFTPGGDVHLLFFDRNGMRLNMSQVVTATPGQSAPNSTTVPYHFSADSGTIHHVIDHACSIRVMVQAYDAQADQLSNIVLIPDLPGICTMSPRQATR
jgi:hypothetical protein